ncbi:sensor histidine kinase [Streptomyces sp. TRM68416]|uniref:sensor histidine kinase n=1 Tax=Streptomyces sp. TRM68416 TaxID=2758412 RepID=UPI001661E711|nr:sensor histidine kinase [Streptomyces sp. TRM68416]MBD0837956.1 sensor histidine kinase [Streptomyces sp. TRM68416]
MVSVQPPPASQPRRRELPYARVLLLPAIVMAAATGAAAAVVTAPARAAVGWCGAVATLLVIATAAEAVRRGRALRDAREEHARHSAYLERRIAVHEQELERLAKEIVPTAIEYLRRGNSPREVVLHIGDIDPSYRDLPKAHLTVIRTVLDIIDHEEALRDSAQRSFVNVARRVQAIVHQQAVELREMEEDHGRNPEVFDDLLRIDHGTMLIGRLADSISVLGGGRPGRQWPEPVALYSVLRGAMSRILEYRRISLDNICKVNIRGISVEPVIHAAAELLDNATRYSPPQSKVHVTATEVQTGVAIEIEDAGVSLSEEARARVENMLEQAKAGVDLQELGVSPRLGLAVVGRLCTAFNMQVSLRTSAYGGVRAVLIVPREMITSEPGVGLAHGIGASAEPQVDLGALEGPKRKPKTRRPTSPRIPASVAMEDDVPVVTEWTANGLPQRRSRVKTPLSQRLAEQAAIEQADREAIARGEKPVWGDPDAAPEPKQDEDDTPPGLWVEAFWEGLKRDPDPNAFTQPTTDSAHAPAEDEGDLK